MAKTANISLPNDVMERLDKEAKKLGVNRSAYISMSLNRQWEQEKVIKAIPELSRLADKLDALDPKE